MAVSGIVYYCPDLRLYAYKITDGSKPNGEGDLDLKFDDDEFEAAVGTHIAQGNQQEAEFVTHITGMARVNPHKIVRFTSETAEVEVIEPAVYWKKHDAERDAMFAEMSKAEEPPAARPKKTR